MFVRRSPWNHNVDQLEAYEPLDRLVERMKEKKMQQQLVRHLYEHATKRQQRQAQMSLISLRLLCGPFDRPSRISGHIGMQTLARRAGMPDWYDETNSSGFPRVHYCFQRRSCHILIQNYFEVIREFDGI